ncbi:hypothetical protein Q1695_013567 [Nippostrongylus brasiliensis]|nr:hypothetical protein Q1695_013567 [Nippostrongylus brasiliensis]
MAEGEDRSVNSDWDSLSLEETTSIGIPMAEGEDRSVNSDWDSLSLEETTSIGVSRRINGLDIPQIIRTSPVPSLSRRMSE